MWQWFEPDETGAICQVEIATEQICNKHYKNGCSTGNLINHLANRHKITEETKKEDFMVREEITLYLFNLGLLIIYFIKLSDYFNTSNRSNST